VTPETRLDWSPGKPLTRAHPSPRVERGEPGIVGRVLKTQLPRVLGRRVVDRRGQSGAGELAIVSISPRPTSVDATLQP